MKQTNINSNYLGFVSTDERGNEKSEHLGGIEQLNEIIKVHSINEVIFCSRNLSSQSIIDYMHTLISSNVDFKIAPPESMSIIGSNSIDTAGDLYIIDVNSISKPQNKRNKRLFDIIVSLLFVAISPLLILFQKNKAGLIKNIFAVLFNQKSWVGYGKNAQENLPKLKSSVLSPTDILDYNRLSTDTKSRVLLAYSKDYKIENDLTILLKCFRKLGS